MLIGKQISGLYPLRHSRFIIDNCRLIIKHSQCKLGQLVEDEPAEKQEKARAARSLSVRGPCLTI